MVLHRKEIADILKEKTGFNKQELKLIIPALKELIYEEVAKGNSIQIWELFTIKPITTKRTKRYDAIQDRWYIDEPHKKVKITLSKMLANCLDDRKNKDEDE